MGYAAVMSLRHSIDLTQEAINAARKWFADNALACPNGAVGARYMGEARGARVVCASARPEQPADRLAQRSVEIDRVHALENAVSARLFDVPNIEIHFDP